MKTWSAVSSVAVVVVVVAVVSVWVVEVQSTTPGREIQRIDCRSPVFDWNNDKNECQYVSEQMKDAVMRELRSRQLNIPNQVCPYCAFGVYDGFPDWSNCSRFNLCLNGKIISLSCTDLGAQFFNPVSKACELYPSQNNVCVNRGVNFLSIQA